MYKTDRVAKLKEKTDKSDTELIRKEKEEIFTNDREKWQIDPKRSVANILPHGRKVGMGLKLISSTSTEQKVD